MSGLFKNFTIVIADEPNHITYDELSVKLLKHGCEDIEVIDSRDLALKLRRSSIKPIDFIISDKYLKYTLSQCVQSRTSMVKSTWVEQCILNNKILPVEPFQWFSDLLRNKNVYISRYSFNEQEYKFLAHMVYLLGGCVSDSISPKFITHFITKSTEPNDKIQNTLLENKAFYKNVEFVTEQWLFDQYFESNFSKKLISSNDNMGSYTTHDSNTLFAQGELFYIDLQMDEPLKTHLVTMIKTAGGECISKRKFEAIMEDNETDLFYIGDFPGNELFNNKCSTRVTINWIFDCILQQHFIQPKPNDKMIYSIPNIRQIKICEGMKISYSQFFGLERFNVINEIGMLGGEAQSFMNKDTDLLIVGHPQGNKYDYAMKHNIAIVSSKWLEDSFKSVERLPYGKYSLFYKSPMIPCNLETELENIDSNDSIITSSPSSNEDNSDVIKRTENSVNTEKASFESSYGSELLMNKDTDTPVNPLSIRKRSREMVTESIEPAKNSKSSSPNGKRSMVTKSIESVECSESPSPSIPMKRTTKRKRTEEKAMEILSHCLKEIKPIYNIYCITTQCLDKITECDKEILRLIGITIYDEINEVNINKLNTVIAPKRLRTLKFLISLSFEPLKYALLPGFITDLLRLIKKGGQDNDTDAIQLDPMQYRIPEMDEGILQKTQLNTKVFPRAHITNINLSSNMQGGTNTLRTILERHGITRVNVLKKKFTSDDVVSNLNNNSNNNNAKPANQNELNGEIPPPPQYILITDQQSQMKQFKTVVSSHKGTNKTLIVEWNWCVQCIFSLEVSYDKKNSTILHYA